jgi:hypothetical protein
MEVDARELLTIGEAAKRLRTTTESALRGRIDRQEVQVIRRYGRILVSEDELRRCFPEEFRAR